MCALNFEAVCCLFLFYAAIYFFNWKADIYIRRMILQFNVAPSADTLQLLHQAFALLGNNLNILALKYTYNVVVLNIKL